MVKTLLFIGALVAGASACCDNVRFDSTGLLAESENRYIIGDYEYVADEAGGYYKCAENGLSLYYYSSRDVSSTHAGWDSWIERETCFFQRWQIGDGPESSPAYAWCYESALCPEDLGPNWEYYAFISGEWIPDPDITVTCQ